MAKIVSGASADELTIDATSKAARVTMYDSGGNEIHPPPTGSYIAPINVRQTAATAADATVWAMRNSNTKTIRIRRIAGIVAFDGTASAATIQRYKFARFSAATPTLGTTIAIIKKRSSYAASSVADIRFLDTGLSTTSVTFETELALAACPSSVTASIHPFNFTFETPGQRYGCVELAANEGFCIRLAIVTIIGTSISGFIEWDEV